jgi:hypothetical protein
VHVRYGRVVLAGVWFESQPTGHLKAVPIASLPLAH